MCLWGFTLDQHFILDRCFPRVRQVTLIQVPKGIDWMVFCVEGNKRVSNQKLLHTALKNVKSSWLQPSSKTIAHCNSAGEMILTHRDDPMSFLTHLQSYFLRHLMKLVFKHTHTHTHNHFGKHSLNTDFVLFPILKCWRVKSQPQCCRKAMMHL